MALTIEQEQALLALLNEKKITLSELPAATEVNEDDLMLIRQGILDKSVNSLVMKRHFMPEAASLTASGITKLSNAIDSDDDYIAATSKAVKTAHDLAIKASSEVSSKSLSKSANLSDVTDVDAVLENLGLLEAAKRSIGNKDNQIPDIGFFTSSLAYNGWQKLPTGLILQWSTVSINPDVSLPTSTGWYQARQSFMFPVSFPTDCVSLTCSLSLGGTAKQWVGIAQVINANRNTAEAIYHSIYKPDSVVAITWIAIGY